MSTFPPTSIGVHTGSIVDTCEVAEMTPGCDPAVPVVELAALLYLGDYIHARHLWRRHRSTGGQLEEWWNLGRALMEHKTGEIWARLRHLGQTQPKPYCDYANEVGEAVRRRMIPKLVTLWNSSTGDVLLGLPRADWAAFLESHRQKLANKEPQQGGDGITETISFLETPALSV